MYNVKRPMISDGLRLLRLYMGLSQKELSRELDVSQSLISEIENGSKAVSMDLLERYSTRFNVRMSDLLFFAEELGADPPKSKGKLIVANATLKLLEKFAPKDIKDVA